MVPAATAIAAVAGGFATAIVATLQPTARPLEPGCADPCNKDTAEWAHWKVKSAFEQQQRHCSQLVPALRSTQRDTRDMSSVPVGSKPVEAVR